VSYFIVATGVGKNQNKLCTPENASAYIMKTLSQVGNWENYLSVDGADRGYAGPVRRMLGCAGQDAFPADSNGRFDPLAH
jgi:hypothetical protein